MRVIIAGGSTFDSLNRMNECLLPVVKDIETIISGRSWGADKLAESFANTNAIDLELFPSNWGKYGENAGYVRWRKVMSKGDVDHVFLFWDGKSKGTKVLKNLVEEFDIPLSICYYEYEGEYIT